MSGEPLGMYAGMSDPPGYGDADPPGYGDGAAKKAEILKWIIDRAEYYESCVRNTPPDMIPNLERVGREVLNGRMDDAALAMQRHLYRGQQECRDRAAYLRDIAAQIEKDC